MITRQFVLDGLIAAGLVSALAVVFIVDRRSQPPERELAEGEEVETKRSLLGTNQPVRRKPAPRVDSIYAERTAENRDEVVKKRGGSPISEQAVQSGLEWLSRHQAQDGSWSNQCLGGAAGSRCARDGRPCSDAGGAFGVAQTGLALLAFQGGGHFTFNETIYSTQVKRGLDWLISKQGPDGCFANHYHVDPKSLQPTKIPNFVQSQHAMYEHAIATFALAEACAIAKDSDQQPETRYHEALEKAIKFIEDFQDPKGGGWRYTPKTAGDSSVSGWVVLALKSAQAAGVQINPYVLRKCISFFESLEIKNTGRTGYANNSQVLTEATTGVGMLVHHFLLDKSDSPLVNAASAYLAKFAENWRDPKGSQGKVQFSTQVDYYLWYNCTLGMYLAGGENWDKWNKIVREAVTRLQLQEGCERGSWSTAGMEKSGGRICSTSLAILTLEVYYRFAKKGKQSKDSQQPNMN